MNFLRNLILENVGLKTASLFLAFLLWWQVSGRQSFQRIVVVPVEFVNIPPNLQVAEDYPREVEVVIRSDRSTATLDERQLAVQLDLRQAEPGTLIIPLREENLKNRPFGVQVVSFDPARIRLRLERVARKIVKVQPRLVGKPPPPYEVTGVRVEPGEVVVTGPESRVRQITEASTEPIELDGKTSSFTQVVGVDVEDPRLQIENVSEVRVEVNIEVQRKEVRIERVPVELTPPDVALRPSVRWVTVIANIPVTFAGEIDRSRLRARVDVSNLNPAEGPFEVTPQVVVPEEYAAILRITGTDPQMIQLRSR